MFVSWVRRNVETEGSEPVFRIMDADGNPVLGTSEVQQIDGTTWASPADIVSLDDGKWMAVWIDNGYFDDRATMIMEGRIFDVSGNSVTGDVAISPDAVDGCDVANFSAMALANGNVVVGFVETSASGSTYNSPQFSIIAPDRRSSQATWRLPKPRIIPGPVRLSSKT